MKSCTRPEADVLIDGQPFRLETLSELEALEGKGGLRGIKLVGYDIRSRLLYSRFAKRAPEPEPQLMDIPISRKPGSWRNE